MIEHGAAVLDQMKDDIKPLLIVIGDMREGYFPKILSEKHDSKNSGFDPYILTFMTRLSYKDTKLIVVDLNDQDDKYSSSKISRHLSDIKLLCFITQGKYFTFNEFMELG